MSYGYSYRLVEANRKAKSDSLGVALGRLCISNNVPVSTVAEALGVSRQTIYNWFWGMQTPTGDAVKAIEKYMHKLSKK